MILHNKRKTKTLIRLHRCECLSVLLFVCKPLKTGFLAKRPIVFLSLRIVFVLANRVDTDEMPHYNAAFHQGIHCMSKDPFRGFQY